MEVPRQPFGKTITNEPFPILNHQWANLQANTGVWKLGNGNESLFVPARDDPAIA